MAPLPEPEDQVAEQVAARDREIARLESAIRSQWAALDQAQAEVADAERRAGEWERQALEERAARDREVSAIAREFDAVRESSDRLGGRVAALESSFEYRFGRRLASDRSRVKIALLLLPRLVALAARAAWRRLRGRHPAISGTEARARLTEQLEAGGVDAAEEWARGAAARGQISERSLMKLLFLLTKDSDPERALGYADRVLELDPDDEVVREMAARRRAGAR